MDETLPASTFVPGRPRPRRPGIVFAPGSVRELLPSTPAADAASDFAARAARQPQGNSLAAAAREEGFIRKYRAITGSTERTALSALMLYDACHGSEPLERN